MNKNESPTTTHSLCLHCKQSIHHDATTCHHCGSNPSHRWFNTKTLSTSVALTAAIAAIIIGYLQFQETKKERISAEVAYKSTLEIAEVITELISINTALEPTPLNFELQYQVLPILRFRTEALIEKLSKEEDFSPGEITKMILEKKSQNEIKGQYLKYVESYQEK